MSDLVEKYRKNGFVVVDVLTAEEVGYYLTELEENIINIKPSATKSNYDRQLDGYFQKEGHKIEEYGTEDKLYYINNVALLKRCEGIRSLFCNYKINNICESIIGSNLALDGSALLLAEPGTSYELSWHRDVIQIPQDEIPDELFSESYFHNNVQINLALRNDESLWVVPGSHNRALTEEETMVFGNSKHYASNNTVLDGQLCVKLKPGQAAIYNNNIVHRGYCEQIKEPRRIVHMGYHSMQHRPTWHAYHLNTQLVEQLDLDIYPMKLKDMISNSLKTMELYPLQSDSWRRIGEEYA